MLYEVITMGAGQVEEAKSSLTEALAVAERTGERRYDVILSLAGGNLLLGEAGRTEDSDLRRKKTAEAEARFLSYNFV